MFGLVQGGARSAAKCVIFPLLLNDIFTAELTVVLQRFREDIVIFAELVYLKEPPTSMAPDLAINSVNRLMWGMLYADDACIVSRSIQGLAQII